MTRRTAQTAKPLEALSQALQRYTRDFPGVNPCRTAIEDFSILRSDRPRDPSFRLFGPALCITAQGAKWASFGAQRFEYPAGKALVVTMDLPSRGGVSAATPTEPFLGIVLALDLALFHEIAAQLPPLGKNYSKDIARHDGVFVLDLTPEMLDCALRAVALLTTPEAIPILYPGILRELMYRTLVGPQGFRLAGLLSRPVSEQRILHAMQTLKTRFSEPIRVEHLANEARMSPATFHRHFKAVTAMSPLQYQKHVRLIEARRLLLIAGTNVEGAAFGVGYESSTQFSRDYSRMFGRPPRRDIAALRQTTVPVDE